MARTHVTVKDVRVPTKLVRANLIKAKFDDHDDALDTLEGSAASQIVNTYDADGAVSPNDDVAKIDASKVGMALTLADGTVVGETMRLVLETISFASGTAVLTPANLTGGTTLTFDAVGEACTLIWVAAGEWTPRPGYTCTLA